MREVVRGHERAYLPTNGSSDAPVMSPLLLPSSPVYTHRTSSVKWAGWAGRGGGGRGGVLSWARRTSCKEQ